MRPLYLASASPRRAELLAQIGAPFMLLKVPGIDETPRTDEAAEAYVVRMALEKASAGRHALPQGAPAEALVLGADTCVVLGQTILGKPADSRQATDMLANLSGREHRVLSAVCLCSVSQYWHGLSETRVWFNSLNDQLISRYVATGEGMDKAGGYGIQGFGALLVEKIQGSYSGVVGLPLAETGALLSTAGAAVWQSIKQEG